MATTKVATIPWAPFTPKHQEYIKKAIVSNISIAEGAVRSGKTIDHCIIFVAYLEMCPDKIHLATGSSVRNAKLNIGDCNGFGLEYQFRGRCRWGKFKDNEALFINSQTGEKVVIFAGGGKADSYRGILGNSYGGWIATEINEHFLDITDPKRSFVHVAIDRQLAAKKPMRLWDLNPSNPNAHIYKFFIDPYTENRTGNYQHFTLYDNGSLSPERIKEIESDYIPGTIWHERNILGRRCVTKGLIYQHYVNNASKFRVEKKELPYFKEIVIGCDWGGNGSAHSFTAVGIPREEDAVYALAARRYEAKGTDALFILNRFNEFYDYVANTYGRPHDGYGDSAEQAILNLICNHGRMKLRNSIKNRIKDRIATTMYLIARNKFFITDDCEPLDVALKQAQWDMKHSDERLDDGTTWIDPLDSFEYAWERYMPYLLRS